MKRNKEIAGTKGGTANGTAGDPVPMSPLAAAIARLIAGSGDFRATAERIERVRGIDRSMVEVASPKVRGYGRVPAPRRAPPPRRKREPRRLLPPRAMSPVDWTEEVVIEWVTEAFRTLVALPRVTGPQGFKSAMPTPVRDAEEVYGYGEVAVRRALPPADAIDRLDIVLDWKGLVLPEDWTLLCHWCRGTPRAELSRMIDRDRSTVRRWVYEVAAKIAKRMRQLQAGDPIAKSTRHLHQNRL